VLVDMAADRGAFIDQSQSFNVFMSDPNFGKLTSLHFHGWRKGLKTGMYYLRTRAAADAIKFTVDQTALKKKTLSKADMTISVEKAPRSPARGLLFDLDREAQLAKMLCSIENKDACVSCGS
jgi:ribonucleoside-diphosphate reductase subunit M1